MARRREREEEFQPAPPEYSPEVLEALEIADAIPETIHEQVSDRARERGASFFEDVEDRARDVAKTIRKYNKVSPRQREVLDNWLAAVRKWVHDDEDD